MAMTGGAVDLCRANTNGCVNNIQCSAYTYLKPTSKSSSVLIQSSPVTRRRAIQHSPPCTSKPFFKGTLALKYLKPRLQTLTLVGSSKIVAQDFEFAEKESLKFKEGLLKKLADDQRFGDARVQVVETCTKIFRQFLMSYDGALLVAPFADMKAAVDEEGLPGGPKAAREALVWAQDHLEDDWKEWCSRNKS
eukprot:Gb_02740 [translate_table: standard]